MNDDAARAQRLQRQRIIDGALYAVIVPPDAQAQGVGEALEAELIALVAGPYHYHHKMDEHAEREGKAFDRCRELTIQNIRTWCATRRAMLAAQPPSAPVGVDDALVAGAMEAAADACSRHVVCNEAITAAVEYALAQQPAAVDEVLAAVRSEVARATAKFPTWPTDPLHASGVVQEESGELAKAVLQVVYEPHKSTPEDAATEAFQTAAMAVRFLMSMPHYDWTPGAQHAQE